MGTDLYRLRNRLVGIPAYPVLRLAYQSLFKRDAIHIRRQRRAFYSSFLRPGNLVFDVGANLGNYAEALLKIGARVVAVEPDPRNLAVLRNRLRSPRVHIEPCAMGSKPGVASLHMHADLDAISTLSKSLAETTACRDMVTVPVSTLDALAEKYGFPDYVKVDTEGFDAEVLRGMTFRPRMVSFEFLPGYEEVALDCVRMLRGYRFNLVFEEESRFEAEHWMSAAEVASRLSSLPAGVRYGDVFAEKC